MNETVCNMQTETSSVTSSQKVSFKRHCAGFADSRVSNTLGMPIMRYQLEVFSLLCWDVAEAPKVPGVVEALLARGAPRLCVPKHYLFTRTTEPHGYRPLRQQPGRDVVRVPARMVPEAALTGT